jgi:hyaluronan synthase
MFYFNQMNIQEYDEDTLKSLNFRRVKKNFINWKLFFWIFFLFGILICPIIIGEVFQINLLNFSSINLSILGFFSSLHFFVQIFISWLNHRTVVKNVKTFELDEGNLSSVGIQVSGWREDPELFEKCLISLKRQTYGNIKYVTFCSDGNEENDLYMSKIFKKVFGEDSKCVIMDKTCKDMTNPEKLTLFNKVGQYKHVCFMQPHYGKRYAMYTQMKNLIHNKCDYVLFIDSDTIVETEAVTKLVKTIKYHNGSTVTGDVRICNPDNLLAYLIALKYWFAFNLERSAQSYFGSVSCIAGPFGLYETKLLHKIVEEWNEQTFMGKECTFGDDRHLTNLVLKYDGTAYYNHDAICYTDTPIEIARFISQQTRWGKSFVREYFLNLSWFSLNKLWLVYDLSFMMVYSLIIMVILASYLLKYDIMIFLFLFSTMIIVSYLRALYAVFLTKDKNYLIFGLYGFVFFFILLPLKYWSFLTFNITNWGTGNRLSKTFKNNDIIPVILWNIFLAYVFIRSVLNIEELNLTIYITTGFIFSNIILLLLLYKFFR